MVAESLQTHTPPDRRAGALALAQEHGEELLQQWQNQRLPMLARLVHHAVPRAHNLMSDARGHARQVQRNTPIRRTDPPQFARASQNIVAAAMLLRDLSELNDPREWVIHRNL